MVNKNDDEKNNKKLSKKKRKGKNCFLQSTCKLILNVSLTHRDLVWTVVSCIRIGQLSFLSSRNNPLCMYMWNDITPREGFVARGNCEKRCQVHDLSGL